MKKLCLSLILAGCAIGAYAEGTTMVFTTTDAVEHSIASKNLTISFVDGMMNATNGSQTLSLPLADLKTMNFSNLVSGLNIIDGTAGAVAVTSLNGTDCGVYTSLAEAQTQLPAGIYIVRTESDQTFKIVVK